MPKNFIYIGLIISALPDAKIVHVTRDAAATCWSNYSHHFDVNGPRYCYNLGDLVAYYRMYRKLMDFWNKIFSNRIYHLDYEKLTLEQENETRNLIKYLGVRWENACLAPHENERIIKTASYQQVRQKVYKGSSQKWRRFKPFLSEAFEEFD